MFNSFSVNWRNPGHWDIYGLGRRLFCIRGNPGSYYVRDECGTGTKVIDATFATVDAAMAYITAALMYERHPGEEGE